MYQHTLQWGLIETVGLTSVVGGVIATRMASRAIATLTASRRRGLFVRRRPRRKCPKCAGFGIQRCVLCRGEGVCTATNNRLSQLIPCPKCTMRRMMHCEMCKGTGRRPLVQMVSISSAPNLSDRLAASGRRLALWLFSSIARRWDNPGDNTSLLLLATTPAIQRLLAQNDWQSPTNTLTRFSAGLRFRGHDRQAIGE